MLSEKAICELFSSMLPAGRENRCFESDAEILRLNGKKKWLFTTDEFSAEDQFRENNPYLLGWNIAAGGISDILACGGQPVFYAHALTVDPRWDAAFLREMGRGLRDVLEATGARFIGGDCGRSQTWRCTVSVLGSCAGEPVRRSGAQAGDALYLSGPVGAGNLEAALRLMGKRHQKAAASIQTRFPVRVRESAVMRKFASACIDTSDGVCAGLHALADVNSCGFIVSETPYLAAGVEFCRQVSLPETMLFLGECGEYELLLTVRTEREAPFLREARKQGCRFHRLGQIERRGRKLITEERVFDLGNWRCQARDFDSAEEYLRNMAEWLSGAGTRATNAAKGGQR